MGTIIDKMYADHKALHDLLTSQSETSLASDADSKLKKVLLVSAASYFASSAESVGSLGFGESS
jgi:hypothetical protein